MVDSNNISMFYQDKQKFFNNYSNSHRSIKYKFDTAYATTTASQAEYEYIYINKNIVEQEVKDLFNVLEAKRHLDPVFWAYCYYCACLLEAYYQGYGQKGKAQDYIDLKTKIKDYQKNANQIGEPELRSFITEMKENFVSELGGFITTPLHIAKLRDKAGITNIWRIYWIFCRFMLERGLKYSREVNLLDKLDDLLGSYTDVDGISAKFDIPSGVLNVLSVALFASRFLINAALVVKHVCFPSEEEKELDWNLRLNNELNKRGVDMINHGSWAIVNLITNYNTLFHISGPATGWIVAGFLIVDVSTLLYKRHQEKQAFLFKRAEYEREIREVIEYLEQAKGDEVKVKVLTQRLRVLTEQQKQLEIDWKTKGATLDLMVVATVMLMFGFGASMIITPALAVIACYFVCIVAVAIYLSEGAFANYKKSKLELGFADESEINSEELQRLQKNYIDARNEYIKTMVKYTIMPSLFIATYAICWPAAVALTVLFIGYELFQAYQKHKEKNEAKKGNGFFCLDARASSASESEDNQETDERLSSDRLLLSPG